MKGLFRWSPKPTWPQCHSLVILRGAVMLSYRMDAVSAGARPVMSCPSQTNDPSKMPPLSVDLPAQAAMADHEICACPT
jgi:hypothetical protein